MDEDIRAHLAIDSTSPTGLRWLVRVNNKCHPEGWAFTSKRKGYYAGKFRGRNLEAHRVVFFLHNGYWAETVDHKDRHPTNNHPDNLRDVSLRRNQENREGAGYTFKAGKYQAQIGVGNHTRYLGRFSTPEEANAAYLTAKLKYHEGFLYDKSHVH